MHRKLRMGMIGGGKGDYIGNIHRMAARMAGQIALVCGVYSSDHEKSMESGKALYLPPDRVYETYSEMIEKESNRPEGERMDFVSIVTPNHVHFEPARQALRHGFHVVMDKPMTFDLDEARQLKELVDESGLTLCLTHAYTGYPMIKEARKMVADNELGEIRKVYVEYPQGWLSGPLEQEGNKQASWRTDPAKSGKAGAMGDIGTHAADLAEYVSGQEITKLCADINTVVDGRMLDDDGSVLLRFDNGASGVLIATQVAAGEENCIRVRVYGEKGGIDWNQEEANKLRIKWLDRPDEEKRTGDNIGSISDLARYNTRTPAGHPEGYLEAFANLYRNFALTVKAHKEGKEPKPVWLDFPGAYEGLRGMLFIDKVIESGNSDKKWIDLD